MRKTEEIQEMLDRYYRGETSLREERELREASREGWLDGEPFPVFGEARFELPEGFAERLSATIEKRKKRRHLPIIVTTGSIAAGLLLILSLQLLTPSVPDGSLQLSDNLKRERFEDALRVIGDVLEERKTPTEKVLYEDEKLIISVE